MHSGDVRRRAHVPNTNTISSPSSNGSMHEVNSRDEKKPIEELHWLIISVILMVVFVIGSSFEISCEDFPWAAGKPSIEDKTAFQETIARGHLWNMTKIGPHPIGSEGNEVYIPKFLKYELNKFTGKTFGDLVTQLDEQISDFGTFTMADVLLPKNFIHLAYENIRNIVFRISSKNRPHPQEQRSAILINCHYDSFPGSPGATDDAISCASMLESIRVILELKPTMQHDLIFLFNGGEEHLLLASHAFVTQHPWMKDVRMFVNLEGSGAGGRQLVFQTGPGNPWIMEEYARTAKQPFASIMGEEVFSSGLIPSDTDFRIFRDFGGVPGMDLAYISNGHLYHTNLDEEKRIPPACLKNSGENLINLLVELVNSPYITHASDYHTKKLVFFDVLGLFMVTYPATLYYCMNLFIIAIIYFRAFLRVIKDQEQFRMLWLAVLNQFVFCIGLSCVLVGTGTIVHYFMRRMSWYTLRFNIVGVFFLPVILYCFTYHGYFSRKLNFWPTPLLAEKSHFDATQILVCHVLFVVTLCGFLSGYVLLPWILFPFFGDLLKNRLQQHIHMPWRDYRSQLIYPLYTMLIIGIAYVYNTYMSQVLLDVFLPIIGRSASSVYPDIFVGAILIVPIIVPTMYLCCDIYLTKQKTISRIKTLVLHSFISYLALVNFTSIGFPFDASVEDPRPHRIGIVHSSFIYRDHHGNIENTDNKLVFSSFDMSGVHPITDVMPNLSLSDLSIFTCPRQPYCGFPHIYPIASIFTEIQYLPIKAAHNLSPPVDLKVLKKVAISDTLFNVSMSMSGPSTSHIFLMTEEGVNLLKWSFDPDGIAPPQQSPVPRDTSEKHYFVMHAYGTKPVKPLEFWGLFRVDKSLPDVKAEVQVALSGVYLHQPGYTTKEMKAVIDLLPGWVSEIHWSATYDLNIIRFRN